MTRKMPGSDLKKNNLDGQLMDEYFAVQSLSVGDVDPTIELLTQRVPISAEFQKSLALFLEEHAPNLKPKRKQGHPGGENEDTEERTRMVAGLVWLVKKRDGLSDERTFEYLRKLGISKKGQGVKAEPGQPTLSEKTIKRHYHVHLKLLKLFGPLLCLPLPSCLDTLRHLEGGPPPLRDEQAQKKENNFWD